MSVSSQTENLPNKYSLSILFVNESWQLLGVGYSYNEYRGKSSKHDNSDLKIFSFNGEVLYENTFAFSNIIYYDSFNETDPGGMKEMDRMDFYLEAQYFMNAKNIVIENSEKNLMLDIDVSHLALCNENGICEDRESESCVDCKGIKPITSSEKPQNYAYIWLAVIVLILIIVYVVHRSKKK